MSKRNRNHKHGVSWGVVVTCMILFFSILIVAQPPQTASALGNGEGAGTLRWAIITQNETLREISTSDIPRETAELINGVEGQVYNLEAVSFATNNASAFYPPYFTKNDENITTITGEGLATVTDFQVNLKPKVEAQIGDYIIYRVYARTTILNFIEKQYDLETLYSIKWQVFQQNYSIEIIETSVSSVELSPGETNYYYMEIANTGTAEADWRIDLGFTASDPTKAWTVQFWHDGLEGGGTPRPPYERPIIIDPIKIKDPILVHEDDLLTEKPDSIFDAQTDFDDLYSVRTAGSADSLMIDGEGYCHFLDIPGGSAVQAYVLVTVPADADATDILNTFLTATVLESSKATDSYNPEPEVAETIELPTYSPYIIIISIITIAILVSYLGIRKKKKGGI